MKPSDASITSRMILSDLFKDSRIDIMLSKFNAGGGAEDLKSELFATLCEKSEDLICDLYNKKQLLYYATAIVQKMIFQPNSRFYRRYRTQSYEYSEAILNQSEEQSEDKEKHLEKLEKAIEKDLHWVEQSVLKLHQDLGSIDEISRRTKISYNQVNRIYTKSKEKLKTSILGKIMGNYIVINAEMVLDIPDSVTPENVNNIIDETLDYLKVRLENRLIPSKEKTNGYIKEIRPIKIKSVI